MRKIYMALAAAGLLLCSCSYIADFNYGAYPEINDGTEKEQEGGDKFEEFADNDFIETSDNNVSTFSVDADGVMTQVGNVGNWYFASQVELYLIAGEYDAETGVVSFQSSYNGSTLQVVLTPITK